MRTALGLAVAALIALILALLTGNILAAVLVVMLALAGIVVLLRDWRAESKKTTTAPVSSEAVEPAPTITGDEFSPDIAGPDQL